MGGEQRRRHQHAHAHEKQTQQQIPERPDVRLDLVAEVAFAQHHAGQKRAQRHGQAQRMGHPGGEQGEQQGGHHEHFVGARPAGLLQGAGQHPLADHIDADEQRQGLAQRGRRRDAGMPAVRVGQYRQQHQHDHRRQVLEQQHPGGGAAVAGVHRAARDQVTDHDGGGGEREGAAGDQRHRRRETQQPHQRRHRQPGEQHLQRAGAEHHTAQGHHFGNREFQPQGKQQKDDAEFRQVQHALGVADPTQTAGAGQHPGAQVGENRRQMQAPEQHHGKHRHGQQDHYLG